MSIYGTKSTFLYNNKEIKYYKSRENSNFEKIRSRFSNKKKSGVLVSFINSVYYKNDLNIIHKKEIIDLMSVCLAMEKSLRTKKWEKVQYIK